MIKIANGVINDEHVDAVMQLGSSGNWEVFMESGARFTISADDAKQFLPVETEPVQP